MPMFHCCRTRNDRFFATRKSEVVENPDLYGVVEITQIEAPNEFVAGMVFAMALHAKPATYPHPSEETKEVIRQLTPEEASYWDETETESCLQLHY